MSVGLIILSLPVWADDLFPAPSAGRSATPVPTNAPLKTLGNGRFEIGQIHFDRNRKTIQLPGTVNMREGLVEYVLVHSTGKVHESLFRTEAEPFHLQLAFLFLTESKPQLDPNAAGPDLTGLTGRKVSLWVSWLRDGVESRIRAEDLVLNLDSKTNMTRGHWIYNGSRVVDGTFLAQRDGSIAAIIRDPDALINNPRLGRENDEIWEALGHRLPPVGTPVQVTIQMENDSN